MAKSFEKFDFDAKACLVQLDELKKLLDSKRDLGERDDVLSFFQDRKHLSAFISAYFSDIVVPNRLAYEYNLFGDFACDLAVGYVSDKAERSSHYCFIEFEGAHAKSLFVTKKGKASSEWSKHFEHGYSQVIDWFWKLDDMRQTNEFKSQFGSLVGYDGVLIIGRSEGLSKKEEDRLHWRRHKVTADTKKVVCLTYDQLYQDLAEKLTRYLTYLPLPKTNLVS